MRTGKNIKLIFKHPKITLPVIGYNDYGEIINLRYYVIIPISNVDAMISLSDDLEECLAIYKRIEGRL